MINRKMALSCAVVLWMATPMVAYGATQAVRTGTVNVVENRAVAKAKYDSQQVTIITNKDIEQKQAKSVEDIIFSETGVSRTVDAMGRVGVSIRGAEPRHTLILVDGQPVMGDFAKYSGAADEVMRLGTENVDHIEIIQGAASAKYGSDAIGGVINIVTKKAGKEPSLQLNAESMRVRGVGEQGFAPHSNYFLRADSGNLGKLRVGLYGSKRDIVPIYAVNGVKFVDSVDKNYNLMPSSLRYYGDTSNIGLLGTYEINKNNSLEFKADHFTEDLMRNVKHTSSELEPQQIYKRKSSRNAYSTIWNGRAGKTNWTLEYNTARIKENDVALVNYTGRSRYEGKNELKYIDDIDHRQQNIKASFNTQLSKKHLVSYGFGMTEEKGSGSRLKSSPNLSTKSVNPWDYDKSLMVDSIDAVPWNENSGDSRKLVWSHLHDYEFKIDEKTGRPTWDREFEYYGTKEKPLVTYEDYIKFKMKEGELSRYYAPDTMSQEQFKNYWEFDKQLHEQNPSLSGNTNIVGKYFEWGSSHKEEFNKTAPTWKGKRFLEEYRSRNNRVTTGSGTIKKRNFFLSDMWRINKNTILQPILRLDYSSLFGNHVSGNMGLTHNINGNANRRLKFNVGTGYAEPGMGELWYNWEMYGSTPVGLGISRMGWYWVGNPDLKPEKSVNFDIGFEAENKNTTVRANVFHNRIKDYMTIYYTGKVMDFAPYLPEFEKWKVAPDLIYSFKNIGKAEITGAQIEWKQRYGSHWSTRLGYTWLHAINKSDPDMPRQLLDKPVHKIDIGITYDNKAGGWNASLWGDYYIDMLDSNTLANSANYWTQGIYKKSAIFDKKKEYKKKTFGIWNLMVQKKINKDSLVYFGINNIFNHHDDDRATQSRLYRFGINLKFGHDSFEKADKNSNKAVQVEREEILLEDFMTRPFVSNKEQGIEFIGDYRVRTNAHGGTNRPEALVRQGSIINTGVKNMLDKSGHGFEERLRIGFDARVAPKTNILFLGSASGTAGVDTVTDLSDSKGLNHQRVEKLDVTQNLNRWDFSIGRLTEEMGATGYWFGKELDGGRAVWTNADESTQVRIGYGSFKHSTGITDSAYTHTEHATFLRPPTADEFLGITRSLFGEGSTLENPLGTVDGSHLGYYRRINEIMKKADRYDETSKAAAVGEAAKLMKEMQGILKQAYGSKFKELGLADFRLPASYSSNAPRVFYQIRKKSDPGVTYYVNAPINYSSKISSSTSKEDAEFINKIKSRFAIDVTDERIYQDNGKGLGREYLEARRNDILSAYKEIGAQRAKAFFNILKEQPYLENLYTKNGDNFTSVTSQDKADDYEIVPNSELYYMKNGYGSNFKVATDDVIMDMLYKRNFDPSEQSSGAYNFSYNYYGEVGGIRDLPQFLYAAAQLMEDTVRVADDGSEQPRAALGDVLGLMIKEQGNAIESDIIPAIDKAAFIQLKKRFGKRFGVSAWYLRSVNDREVTEVAANKDHNDIAKFDQIANVFGIGFQYQIGRKAKLSFDYGQNRSDFGRYMNGTTKGSMERDSAEYTPLGRDIGGVPHFWIVRLDIGKADTNVVGSWNAFADYKYFAHGSFFGGNGTEAVPDRYLDGMRSFTVGAGYVPVKDLLLEAFYTFDVKGIHQRDTVFGPENFGLGSYSRVQATYKF